TTPAPGRSSRIAAGTGGTEMSRPTTGARTAGVRLTPAEWAEAEGFGGPSPFLRSLVDAHMTRPFRGFRPEADADPLPLAREDVQPRFRQGEGKDGPLVWSSERGESITVEDHAKTINERS